MNMRAGLWLAGQHQRRLSTRYGIARRDHYLRTYFRHDLLCVRFSCMTPFPCALTYLQQNRLYSARSLGRVRFDFALPQHNCIPAQFLQIRELYSVPVQISCEFGAPISSVRTGRRRTRTPLVAMPEATMDEHGDLLSTKHDIRTSRKIACVFGEPQSQRSKSRL